MRDMETDSEGRKQPVGTPFGGSKPRARGYPHQSAFILVGDGGNGKSPLLSLLTEFLGPENVSSISLQDLVNHKFTAAELFEERANIYDDLSSDALKRTGQFKMATGGDMLKGEKKFKNLELSASAEKGGNQYPYNAEPVITISKLKVSTPLTEGATLNVMTISLTSPEEIVLPS